MNNLKQGCKEKTNELINSQKKKQIIEYLKSNLFITNLIRRNPLAFNGLVQSSIEQIPGGNNQKKKIINK